MEGEENEAPVATLAETEIGPEAFEAADALLTEEEGGGGAKAAPPESGEAAPPPEEVPEEEVDAEPESEPSATDKLLSGEVPSDLAWLRSEAEAGNLEELTPEEFDALPLNAKKALAHILARQSEGQKAIEEAKSQTAKELEEALAARKRAEELRAKQLEWAQGRNVQEHREHYAQVLADGPPERDDPDFVVKMTEFAVAQRFADFWGRIDQDSQDRQAVVEQTRLNEDYAKYVSDAEEFRAEYAEALSVPGEKETVERWEYNAEGKPVQVRRIIEKRTELARRISEVQDRYGADPKDPRRYLLTERAAMPIALAELQGEVDGAALRESQLAAQKRIVKPDHKPKPLAEPSDWEDGEAVARFLANNPEWVDRTLAEAGFSQE